MLAEDIKLPEQGEEQTEELVFASIRSVAASLGLHIERSQLDLATLCSAGVSASDSLNVAANELGLAMGEMATEDRDEVWELAQEGFPILFVCESNKCSVLSRRESSNFELQQIDSNGYSRSQSVSRWTWNSFLDGFRDYRCFVVKRELECESLSAAPMHHYESNAEGKPLSPVRRFAQLLRMDARDIFTASLFALVSGVLGLATPLAVETLVNVVSWGTYLQPLIVLAGILLVSLGLSAALTILQTIVVEIIQRRQLVRIVSDLAHRFPLARADFLRGKYPRELANRVFDIMTIQKATAILLMDGVSILLTAILGLMLLAFYHPFLLGFDLVLLVCMTWVTFFLGRGGIQTAIHESKTKYKIAHWLQDVLDSPGAFQTNGGRTLSIERANTLAASYVNARKQQFQVVLRQVVFAIGLQVVASTVLLGLGGWLVIEGQLTLGQLVASELVVTVVVGAFSKAGKSLEKFYDLMAGIDKVSNLLDIPADTHARVAFAEGEALPVAWDNLLIRTPTEAVTISADRIEAGEKIGIKEDGPARLLLQSIVGLRDPISGHIEVDGIESAKLVHGARGQAIGWASGSEVFNASIQDNVALGRPGVGQTRVREVLQIVELWDTVSRMEDGLEAELQTDGYPLSGPQQAKLMIARSLAASPGLLIIHNCLDELGEREQELVLRRILDMPNTTLMVASRSSLILNMLAPKEIL
ncbi:MAG: ATP-binding cassette domain-containing protein [Planctomycetota bacterium]